MATLQITRTRRVAPALALSVLMACGGGGDGSSSASDGDGSSSGGGPGGPATSSSTSDGSASASGTTTTTGNDPTSGGTQSGTTGDGGQVAACLMGYPIPSSADKQIPGDAAAGYNALLNEGYVTCGIPWTLFPIAKPLLGSFVDGEPLPGRTGKNAQVPYNWTVHISKSSGAEIVSLNCLECHAGHFDGKLIVGLGKADADYTESIGGPLAQIPIPPIPIPGLEEMTRMAKRYQIIGDYVKMPVVGVNPADALAAVLSSHHDANTLEWHDEPSIPHPDQTLPVDTPPWWNTKKRNGLFWNGMSRGDHRATMIYASALCTDSVEEAQGILSYFNNIRAYIMSVEVPKYPFPINYDLAAEGEQTFNSDCSCCHGTYSDDPAKETYPNMLIPVDVIGTDPLLSVAADALPFKDWFNSSWYGQIGQLTTGMPFPGYVAPPLDGIWASAPYFHNASVPTIDLVLQSGKRPQWWRRVDFDTTNYDQEKVGWPWVELPYGNADAPDDEKKFVYDTTLSGMKNTGHPFGDHLTDQERRAVLEYLKTL